MHTLVVLVAKHLEQIVQFRRQDDLGAPVFGACVSRFLRIKWQVFATA
jgi:hypothetical protein